MSCKNRAPSPRPFRSALGLLAMALLTVLPVYAAPVRAATVQTEWILERLERPAPMRTGFVELRGSALLKEPLQISGEYQRPRDGVLVREVMVPYAETITITQGAVTIARAGKNPRTFASSRAPELAGLQASFGALLAGDREQLEQHYRIESDGTREHWTLVLTPRSADLAATLQSVVLRGRGAELRCIETQPVKGDLQRTLLAGAARSAQDIRGAAQLAALCRGDRAS